MVAIGISDVLHKFDVAIDDEGNTLLYGFRYVKADGTIGEKECYKKYSNKMQGSKAYQSKPGARKPNKNRKKGILSVHDILQNAPRSLKVAHLIEFKDNNSTKWLRIRH